MFEKSILVVYFNVGHIENETRARQSTASLMNYINHLFHDEKDLMIIVIPVKDQQTKVELLNASYPKWEEVLEQIKKFDLLKNEES